MYSMLDVTPLSLIRNRFTSFAVSYVDPSVRYVLSEHILFAVLTVIEINFKTDAV